MKEQIWVTLHPCGLDAGSIASMLWFLWLNRKDPKFHNHHTEPFSLFSKAIAATFAYRTVSNLPEGTCNMPKSLSFSFSLPPPPSSSHSSLPTSNHPSPPTSFSLFCDGSYDCSKGLAEQGSS